MSEEKTLIDIENLLKDKDKDINDKTINLIKSDLENLGIEDFSKFYKFFNNFNYLSIKNITEFYSKFSSSYDNDINEQFRIDFYNQIYEYNYGVDDFVGQLDQTIQNSKAMIEEFREKHYKSPKKISENEINTENTDYKRSNEKKDVVLSGLLFETAVSDDYVESTIIQMLEQSRDIKDGQNEFKDVIDGLEKGTFKIVKNRLGGSSKNKFIVIKPGDPEEYVLFLKFFDSSLEKTDIGSVPNEQKNLGLVTEAINKTKFKFNGEEEELSKYFSTCNMTCIEDSDLPNFNMIVTRPAKNMGMIFGKFKSDKDGNITALKGDINYGVEDILLELSGNADINKEDEFDKYCDGLDKQINFVKSLYAYFAIMPTFDIHDMRPFGNIAVDKETGQIQTFDFDLEKGIALGINEETLEPDYRKVKNLNEISFLKDKPEAMNFAELCKDLTIWRKKHPMAMIANMVLPMYELLTGKPGVEGSEVKFSIPDKMKEIEKQIEVLKQNEKGNEEKIKKLGAYSKQLECLKEYQKCTADIIVGLTDAVDTKLVETQKEIYEQEKKYLK